MPLTIAPSDVPAFAVWFGGAGVFVAIAGLIIGRDESVEKACRRSSELPLADLNEHLRRKAIVPNTLHLSSGTVYDIIRTEADFDTLTQKVNRIASAQGPVRLTKRLTRVTVFLGVAYVLSGITIVSLGLLGAIGTGANTTESLASWLGLSGLLALALLAKACIFAAKGE